MESFEENGQLSHEEADRVVNSGKYAAWQEVIARYGPDGEATLIARAQVVLQERRDGRAQLLQKLPDGGIARRVMEECVLPLCKNGNH